MQRKPRFRLKSKTSPDEGQSLPKTLIYISCGWESFKEVLLGLKFLYCLLRISMQLDLILLWFWANFENTNYCLKLLMHQLLNRIVSRRSVRNGIWIKPMVLISFLAPRGNTFLIFSVSFRRHIIHLVAGRIILLNEQWHHSVVV